MSSQIVRSKFNAEFASLGVPYYDTVNQAHKPNGPIWFSAEFYSDYVTQECFGGHKSVERGTVDVQIFTPAGSGSVAALTFAQVIVDHFRVWRSGELEIADFITPAEIGDGGAESRWYGVLVNLEYNFRF